jgi:hypothetical protein
MTIIIANHPLGEAVPVKKIRFKNQSPNAAAEGDLFL